MAKYGTTPTKEIRGKIKEAEEGLHRFLGEPMIKRKRDISLLKKELERRERD